MGSEEVQAVKGKVPALRSDWLPRTAPPHEAGQATSPLWLLVGMRGIRATSRHAVVTGGQRDDTRQVRSRC